MGNNNWLVARPRLLAKLGESRAPLVLLVAPSGYGKSVLVGQWEAASSRPFAALLLGPEHNDPALLVASILAALDPIEPLPADIATALDNPRPNLAKVVLPRLARALGERRRPFVLVLDDFERIESPGSLAVVEAILAGLGERSQLVLATRSEPALPLGRLRAAGRLEEIGRAELSMTRGEGGALVAAVGLKPTPRQLETLLARTEGWPVALYLAGLALAEAPDLGRAIARFAGDDRIVVDYVRDEFLESATSSRVELLRRLAVLDRLSGELCDAVLERGGSATMLRDLSRSNMLLVPLDRHDEWFRFHPLLREMLRAELHRTEPEVEMALNRRAAEWWAAQGDFDRAIGHAIESGSTAFAGELLWAGLTDYMTRGRNATVLGWLERLGEPTVATDAALALSAAWANLTLGDSGRTWHWAAVTTTLLAPEPASERKSALEAGLALVEATLARDGVEPIADRAALAAEMLPDESPWMSLCRLIEGAALHLRGQREEAREKLADGARRGAVGAPNVQVICLAQLALLAIEEDDWQLAEMLASQARAQIDRSGLGDYPMMALPLAVSALVRSRVGRTDEARADLRQSAELLEALEEFTPWYRAETWFLLGRASIRLGETAAAPAMLDQARRVLRLTPDAVVLGGWIAEAEAAVTAASESAAASKSLSPAELRILQFLPTHLSFPEIAAEVFVSSNTVKTQVQGVYRKLGASSRREAVEQARAAGLLGETGSSLTH
jgi:LuxR family maltose regulon positive regulatory protein